MEDEDYFNRLKAENEKVIVIPTYYDSDIQQAIIKRAQFVVGARYHTIVFLLIMRLLLFAYLMNIK